MNGMVLVASALCGLVLATLAASLLALLRTKELAVAEQRARAVEEDRDWAWDAIHQRLDALAARMEEVRAAPPAAVPPPVRSGMNLSRRSETLRRHRRGESAWQIARQLEIPLQEVELLIKVHEIVMSTV